ncbi:hypothetical protein BaRGS_00031758 [Batillaria attramentaria]|uniref:G-protein coupled receptors family 1 profile domain-containing protein n=1 Tax=Batillaria attramentaria TaxID=370345 RepID=A0ABD0JQ50_9CAEN
MDMTTEADSFTIDVITMTSPMWEEGVGSIDATQAPESGGVDYQRIWNGALASLMILINGSTFVIVVKTKKLKPKTKLLIGSLACTDTLFGLMSLLPRVLTWQPQSQDIVCYVRFSGLFLSIYGTAFTVTLIALDRATAISAPHTYRVMVSTTVMALTVAAVWGLSALMVVISLVGGFPPGIPCTSPLYILSVHGLKSLGTVLLLSSAALFILYAIIGWKMKKRLAQVGVDPSQNGPSRRSERRTTMTGLILALVFLFGYIPVALYLLWVTDSGVDLNKEDRALQLYILVICPNACCVLDPIVYFWRIKEFNSAIFAKCPCRGNNRGDSTDGGIAVPGLSRSPSTRNTDRSSSNTAGPREGDVLPENDRGGVMQAIEMK